MLKRRPTPIRNEVLPGRVHAVTQLVEVGRVDDLQGPPCPGCARLGGRDRSNCLVGSPWRVGVRPPRCGVRWPDQSKPGRRDDPILPGRRPCVVARSPESRAGGSLLPKDGGRSSCHGAVGPSRVWWAGAWPAVTFPWAVGLGSAELVVAAANADGCAKVGRTRCPRTLI